MNITTVRDGSELTVKVEGRHDAITSPQFEHTLDENIAGVDELVIDLAATEYLSSAGLRAILYVQKKMNEQGSMKVLNVSPEVMEIFEVTGFAKILTFG